MVDARRTSSSTFARPKSMILSVRSRVRKRFEVLTSRWRLSETFPGDPDTGLLDESEQGQELFAEFANDEVCPALDPETGACELYEARPMTCRVFGPPVQSEDGIGTCELCFQGASDEEIAACEMFPDPDGLEETLLQELEIAAKLRGNTIVAFCLAK